MLPYGQMSLWGVFFASNVFFISLGFVFIAIISLNTNDILSKIKGVNRIGPHNKDVMSIIYGSLLGDAHAEKWLSGIGTRISFFQQDTHLKYIYYLHDLLSAAGYCNSKLPIARKRLGSEGKVRKVARFQTWTYTSFNFIRDQWYINNKKRVPNNISDYLTPLALAIWIMDDGAKVGKGLKFSTNSFTYEECNTLVNVLYNNFNLKASVQKTGADNQYIIYIWKESMIDLYRIVNSYIIPEMKYKIIL